MHRDALDLLEVLNLVANQILHIERCVSASLNLEVELFQGRIARSRENHGEHFEVERTEVCGGDEEREVLQDRRGHLGE